jgi:hypothetical protein
MRGGVGNIGRKGEGKGVGMGMAKMKANSQKMKANNSRNEGCEVDGESASSGCYEKEILERMSS